ncbi:hypothetical protein DL765_005535 [Monosporascus sp. GIB2]|nr:hypothetical protein DL765_005535 [Monosporascus sp. GIB2]
MLVPVELLTIAALALPGALAAPAPIEMVMDGGITLKLVDGDILQRLDADGTLLGETALKGESLEEFKALASNGQTERRDNALLAPRACLIGHGCTPGDDATCWYNGCVGCLALSNGAGYCVGSIS